MRFLELSDAALGDGSTAAGVASFWAALALPLAEAGGGKAESSLGICAPVLTALPLLLTDSAWSFLVAGAETEADGGAEPPLGVCAAM